MDLSFENDTSVKARFKRELRNPSMITVGLIALAALTIVLAPFASSWISTTQAGFEAMAKQKERNAANKSSLEASVPSQIAPWIAAQARTMTEAQGPLEWKVVSFKSGPCAPENLAQLPAGKYSSAIAQACGSLDDIQQRYSRDCFLATTCDVPELAKTEITGAMDVVWEAFSDAGFVMPYSETEQQVFP